MYKSKFNNHFKERLKQYIIDCKGDEDSEDSEDLDEAFEALILDSMSIIRASKASSRSSESSLSSSPLQSMMYCLRRSLKWLLNLLLYISLAFVRSLCMCFYNQQS